MNMADVMQMNYMIQQFEAIGAWGMAQVLRDQLEKSLENCRDQLVWN